MGGSKAVSEEKIFRNRPIRNKNCLWWPCLLLDQDKISNLHREVAIDTSLQVSVHLWPPQTILVSDWSISKKNSPVKLLGQINRNLEGSIYGNSSVKIANFVLIQ
jgi:hypothetical protein